VDNCDQEKLMWHLLASEETVHKMPCAVLYTSENRKLLLVEPPLQKKVHNADSDALMVNCTQYMYIVSFSYRNRVSLIIIIKTA
jgi:hypothetical protein